jgi:hypothetical protein
MAAISIPIAPAARGVGVVAAAAAVSLPAAAVVVRSAANMPASFSAAATASMAPAVPPAMSASSAAATLGEGQSWRRKCEGDYRYDHNHRLHAFKSHLSLLFSVVLFCRVKGCLQCRRTRMPFVAS